MPTLDLDGRELHYEVTGEGPAVVLIHSAIADHTLWDPQVEALAPRFRVVRYDVAGFGRSPLPPGPFSHLADLDALVEQVGLTRASVVGSSFGGGIALEYALARQDLVDALVLVAPGLPDHDWSEERQRVDEEETRLFEAGDFDGAAEGQLRAWVDGPRRGPDAVDPALRERARRMILRSYEHYADAEKAGEPTPQWPDPRAVTRLGELRIPTLVVVGDEEASDMLEIGRRLEREIAGARMVVVPDAAHLLPLERPEELNRVLLEFLSAR
jgi:3-oxoadipate enol-lactonase